LSDWETIRAFENADGQYMTARWLNKVINNLSWCYQSAVYGASPFRSVKHMASTADTYETAFYGRYYHQHTNLVMVYDLLAESIGTNSSEETDGAYEPQNGNDCDNDWGSHKDSFQTDGTAEGGHNLDMQFCLKKGSTWYVYYSGAWHAMPDATPTDHIDCSTPVPDAADNKTGQGVDADISGLGLTIGNVYDVKVQIRNCAVNVRYIYGEHVLGETYSLPASVADGVNLHYHDWNLYTSSLDYLKRAVDTPRGPTWGVYQRDGDNNGDNHPIRVWRGWVKHAGNTLKYRWLQEVIGSGNCEGHLYYNGVELTNALTGEEALPLITPATATATPPATQTHIWSVAEGSADLTALGLTIGNLYQLDVQITSTDTNANPPQGTVDYLFEVDGLPSSALACHHPVVHGGYIRGDVYEIPDENFHAASLSADFGTVKAKADLCCQMVCPDTATDGTWPSAPYHANDLSFIRQRTTLHWAAAVASTETASIYWGDGDASSQQEFGDGVTSGIIDLRSLADLDVGVRYWLNPKADIVYAFEV
jgi:hypothetical protein